MTTSNQASMVQGNSGDVHIEFKDNASYHLHVGDQVTNHYCVDTPPSTSVPQTNDALMQRILTTIHKNTWEKTHFKIRDTFKADKFPEPDFEVYPEMVESPYFYQGGHPTVDFEDESDEDSESEAMCVPTKRPQYSIDNKFLYYEDEDDPTPQVLSAKCIMEKIHERDEKFGILGIVAQAGAGKTTCLRRWARDTMQASGMRPENGYRQSEDSRFKMVHFIEMKNIGYSKETTLQEMLFREFFRNADDAKEAYDWLNENQDKAVIFLDGLDQARWKIEEDDLDHVGRYDTSSTTNIFANLLTRNLLPGVRIILSSREHTATSLPEETWLDDVVTLTGFTEDDAKKLFNAITTSTTPAEKKIPVKRAYQDNSVASNQKITNWDILASTSTAVLPFISVPAFLMFTAIVFNTFRTAPTSITDLMAKVVGSLEYSLVIKEKKQIYSIINNLKQLSHTGMESGLVIFSKDDLDKYHLDAKQIRDLILMVPRSRSLSRNLVEGDNVFFFCHQIIQEFLSACAIAEMNVEDFRKFVRTKLNKDRWSVVRRFVCGLIFTVSSQYGKILKVSDREEKQRILRDSLSSQLQVEENWKWFELYAAIYESKDDDLIKLIKKIDMYLPTINAIHLVSALMAKSKQFDCINCNEFSDDLLKIMIRNLGKTEVKAGSIQLTTNSKFTSKTLNEFLRIVISDNIQMRHGYTVVDEDGLDLTNICRLKIEIYWSDMWIILQKQNSDEVTLVINDDEKGTAPLHFGTFNIEEKVLAIDASSLDCSFLAYCTEVARYYLKPTTILFNVEGKPTTQYIFHAHIDSMMSWQTNTKIDEVLLVFVYHKHDEDEEEYDIGDRLRHCEHKLFSFVERFQVRTLDIAILPGDIGNVPASLRHALHQLGCEVKINVVEVVGGDSDLPRLSNKLHGHQVDSLRIRTWYKVSNETLESLIESLTATRNLWVYFITPEEEENMYSASDEKGLREIATSFGIDLKFDSGEKRDDPWSTVLALI